MVVVCSFRLSGLARLKRSPGIVFAGFERMLELFSTVRSFIGCECYVGPFVCDRDEGLLAW